MIGNIFKVLISVKAKLFFGFFAMVVIIALLGGYAFTSIGSAGNVVKNTYDRPLMAINFARSAGQVFSQLEIEALQQSLESQSEFKAEEMGSALTRFKEDLAIAKERSIAQRADQFFVAVEESLAEWETIVFNPTIQLTPARIKLAQPLADDIEENLDIIVELQTNASFLTRENSISKMEQIKTYNLWAVIAALTITLGLSIWVAVTIVNPLKTAAAAARKISAGNFNVDIPAGGDDETGVLLKTMSAMQKNIRDRLGREESLRSLAQHRLSDSLNNSQDAILLTDQTNMIIVANPQMAQIFPAIADIDLVGKPFHAFFEPSGCSLNEPCELKAQTDEIAFTDGRWARVSKSSTNEGGQLFIWSDITQQKARSLKLKDAKEAAEAADKAKSLFLAAMSHELRTPLNAVIGFSDALEEHHKSESGDESLAEMAGLISKSGAQLLNIIKDVLSVAKGIDEAKSPDEMIEMNLFEAVKFSAQIIEVEAKDKNIRIITPPAETPFVIKGDIVRIQQLLLNLLSNAVKFNEENGAVKIQIEPHISGWVRCDVIDNGIGISEDNLEKIMQPFIQADTGHTRKYDGMGLGLTIVRQIVDSHQGKMKISSKLGKGTVISLYFPTLTKPQSVPAMRMAS